LRGVSAQPWAAQALPLTTGIGLLLALIGAELLRRRDVL
jgi:hypothetical protein